MQHNENQPTYKEVDRHEITTGLWEEKNVHDKIKKKLIILKHSKK